MKTTSVLVTKGGESLPPTMGTKMKANCIDTGDSWRVLFASEWQLMLSEGQMTRRFQRLPLLISTGAERNHFLCPLLFCDIYVQTSMEVVLNVNWNPQCLCLCS